LARLWTKDAVRRDHNHFLSELETHKKILYKIIRVYGPTLADRQDLAQDIVIALWRSYDQFDGRSKFSTWMYRVALNVALLWVREHRDVRNHVALDDGILDTTLVDEADDAMPMELRMFLGQLVERLSPLDRALILLSLEGHDHAGIGAILGLTPTNVATRLSRVKQKLREQYAA
jgi:RNA polymerase sigma-70 factor (ECF subfamily)